MRGTDGVAPHLLHHLDLTDEGRLVDGSTQRTEVVMQTNTFNFTCDTIQLELTLGSTTLAD